MAVHHRGKAMGLCIVFNLYQLAHNRLRKYLMYLSIHAASAGVCSSNTDSKNSRTDCTPDHIQVVPYCAQALLGFQLLQAG